ncbi:MAG: helix-turn-helix domain-containing protein [Pseudomonadota bacterium]
MYRAKEASIEQMDVGITFSDVDESGEIGNSTAPPEVRKIVLETIVSDVFDIPFDDLRLASRGCASVALARQVAMYLAHVHFGLSFTEVGRVFRRDRTTVAHACSVIEDRRDNASFDYVLELLERVAAAYDAPRPTVLDCM